MASVKRGLKRGQEARRTRPSDASKSLTGHSRTEARTQKDEGSIGEAVGYQAKSSIGADWGRTRDGDANEQGQRGGT